MSLIDAVIRREHYLKLHDLIIEEIPDMTEIDKIDKSLSDFEYSLNRLNSKLSKPHKGGGAKLNILDEDIDNNKAI